jgi:hypothetical protein
MGAPPGEDAVSLRPRPGAEQLGAMFGRNGHELPPAEPPPEPDEDPPERQRPDAVSQVDIDRRYLELTAKLLDVNGLRNIPAPQPIVEGYLYRNSLAWLGGKPGHAKSFIAVDLACCMAAGVPWLGHDVTQGSVLYMIAEGAAGLSDRVDAWILANGQHAERLRSRLSFLPVPVQLMVGRDVAAFQQLINDLEPALIIIDTQARVTVGAEENSSRDMGVFVDALEALRRASSSCILVVHHEPRNGENLRGSTALEGAATTIIRSSKDGALVTVSNPKQKDALEQADLTLAMTPVGDSAVLSHEAVGIASSTTDSENQILIILRDTFGNREANATEFREAANLPKTTWYRAINDLVTKGLLLKGKSGSSTIYSLPAAENSPHSHESHRVPVPRPGKVPSPTHL